jgi:hypothetical protein
VEKALSNGYKISISYSLTQVSENRKVEKKTIILNDYVDIKCYFLYNCLYLHKYIFNIYNIDEYI